MGFNTAFRRINPDTLAFALKHGKRDSRILGFDFESLIHCSFGFLKFDLMDYINECNFEGLIIRMFKERGKNVFHYELESVPNNQFIYFLCWIKSELEEIANIEKKYLTTEDVDTDLIAAGIRDLDKFGNLNILDSLSGGDLTKYEAIKKLPYSLVFDKQYKTNVENQINKKHQKILTSKTKRK